jgi:spore coat polysaccharide biosynthesis predicted glycosyltransferase SpsG
MPLSNPITNIYFRLDFGGFIGKGHLSRCTHLAHAFFSSGYKPIFVIRKRPHCEATQLSYPVIWLENSDQIISTDIHSWKVGSEESEAMEFTSQVPKNSLVVLDHYALGQTWQDHVTTLDYTIILIEDQPKLHPNPNFFVLNYNLGAEQSYQNRDQNRFLLGSSFAPLASVYHRFHQWNSITSPPKKLLIYLGGIETSLIYKLAKAIAETNIFMNLEITWIVSRDDEALLIKEILSNHPIRILKNLPSLAEEYLKVDLVIGACGVSFLERAALGKWQLVFVVADNQLDIALNIQKLNLGFLLGDLRTLSIRDVSSKLVDHLEISMDHINRVTENLFHLVDGKGCDRIVNHISKRLFK